MSQILASEVRYSLGQIAFEEYYTSRKGKDVNGNQIPQWFELRDEITQAWEDAAQRVVVAYNQGVR